ncbi:unnamed protein product [Microthlaspi erraticum]|uniref:Uncharacterized protein n=1 Tax=Microthlaspi erraticum TaxID=1685480 RepID=A0A6D2K6Q3_9BRAS|nr:unnamed protein product [Microthlaspi erraticum]
MSYEIARNRSTGMLIGHCQLPFQVVPVRDLPMRTPLQPCEDEVEVGTSRKLWSLQYFPCRTRSNRQFGFCRIRQLSLASRASLKLWISRKPKPPEVLDFVIFVHEIQLIFCSEGVESHQKRVSADCIRLQRLTGILKHDMEYVGIAERTLLISVNLPAVESRLEA